MSLVDASLPLALLDPCFDSSIPSWTTLTYSFCSWVFGSVRPEPFRSMALVPQSSSLRVFDIYHLLFLSTPRPFNLILSLPLYVFFRPLFAYSVSPLVFAYGLLSILFTCGLPLNWPRHDPDCPGSGSALYRFLRISLAVDQLFPGPHSVPPVSTSSAPPWLWGPWVSLGSAITILFPIYASYLIWWLHQHTLLLLRYITYINKDSFPLIIPPRWM